MANDVKVLKLITGEEVIARVSTESSNLLTLDKPMILQMMPANQQGQVGFAIVIENTIDATVIIILAF